MYIEPIVFIGILVVNFILFGVVFYFLLFRKAERKQSGGSTEVQDKILREAQDEASKIVQSSVEKAQETLLDAQYIKDDLIKSVESGMRSVAESAIISFQEEAQAQHSRFQDIFSEIKSEYEEETKKSVAALDKEAEQQMREFREALAQETVNAQKKAEERTSEAYRVTVSEIEKYKKEKMAEVDREAQEMVQEVFSKVLGKSLTSAEQARLVKEALEDAKKSGLTVSDREK